MGARGGKGVIVLCGSLAMYRTMFIWEATGSCWSDRIGGGCATWGVRQVCEIEQVEMANMCVIGVVEGGFNNRPGADCRRSGVCKAWGVKEMHSYIEIRRSAKLGMRLVFEVCDVGEICLTCGS